MSGEHFKRLEDYHIDLRLDYLDMYMILVMIIGLLQIIKYWALITI